MNQTIIMAVIIGFFTALLWFGVYFSTLFLQKTGIITNPTLFRTINIIGIAMLVILVVTMFFGRNAWSSINAIAYTTVSGWLAIVAGVFFATFIGWIIYAIIQIFDLHIPVWPLGAIALILGITVSVYGIINASIVRTNLVTVEAPNLAALSGKRIALVSDLHIGLVRQKNLSKKVTEKIMAEKPDMILIAGDLIDGPHFPYQEFLTPLAQLSAPLGVYFTPGNHETYNDELEKVYQAIPKNITILADETMTIPDTGIVVAGFEYDTESDEHFKERATRIIDNNNPTVAILHDPKHRNILSELNIPLVVSGHTHGGQFFPGTVIVRMIYGEKTKGLITHDKGAYYTTTGAGTALFPARVGTQSEVVMLDIK